MISAIISLESLTCPAMHSLQSPKVEGGDLPHAVRDDSFVWVVGSAFSLSILKEYETKNEVSN